MLSKPVMKPIKSLQQMQELQAKEDAQTSRLTENSSLANKIIKDGYEVTIEAEYIVDGRKKRRVKKKKIKKVDS